MIVRTTYKCGCPEPLSLIKLDKDFSKKPCSSCCPHPPKSQSKMLSAKPVTSTSRWNRISSGQHSLPFCPKSRIDEVVPSTTEKVVSHIVKKGQPYKEIEAIFNGNHVVIRTQKEPAYEKFDPPCECVGQKSSELSLTMQENDVAFQMEQGSLELQRVPRETTSEEKIDEKPVCRTVTLYPEADDVTKKQLGTNAEQDKKPEKQPIDFEENPNIFVLRIRKYNNVNKEQKIDFEFRSPRPWREICKKKLEKHMGLEAHER